jgi:hypothetical protein
MATRRRALVAVVCILSGLLLVLWQQGLRVLSGWDGGAVRLSHVRGTPLQGALQLQVAGYWLGLGWRWCPGWNPLGWCVQLQGSGIQGAAQVYLTGAGVQLRQGRLQVAAVPLQLSGLPPMEATVRADPLSLTWRPGAGRDVLAQVPALDMQALLQPLYLLQQPLAPHHLHLQRQEGGALQVAVGGDNARGELTLAADYSYRVALQLTPPPALLPLVQGQLPPGASGGYVLQRRGVFVPARL